MVAHVLGLGGAVALAQPVVINEIHYDPVDGQGGEFIELHNTSGSAVNLSGWRFDAGIDFTFPSGASIPANGYAVVAIDPAAFQTHYGFAPFGPFTSKLANEGEQVRLRNASNVIQDDVTYGIGFPWPTASRGTGASMELINPSLNRNLGGSWRASGNSPGGDEPQALIPAADPSWHWRKGTSEASSPVTAWRQTGFVEDGTWSVDRTSIGYGDDDDNTEIDDMQGSYTSLFLRRVFTVPAGPLPSSLTLGARVDDGCIVWINGVEVARFHVSANLTPAFNSFADDHDAHPSNFETVTLGNVSAYLVTGENVISVQAFNTSLNSSDFTIDVKLEIPAGGPGGNSPTPGMVNSVYSVTAPPAVRDVANSPQQPAAGQAVTITARITDPDGMGAVSLEYQLVNPGGYIRKTDAAYAASWTSVPMFDDGTNGDVAAGDGIYTAVLPAVLQTHRRLVRYRIIAADVPGASVTVPYNDDDAPNFAYFVYTAIPDWSGAFVPGSTPAVAYPGSLLGSLPTYHLIASSADVSASQYSSSSNGVRFYGTLIYNGKIYDHIQFNNRGEVSTYTSGKNKWRFHFNRARDFEALDNWGRPYATPWDELNLNACASPWVPMHRGMAGVEEAVSLRLYELVGGLAPHHHYIHFRVVDDAGESGATQFSGGNPSGVNGGDLWGFYLAVEQPDGSFLDSRGLPDGSVYKIESSGGDKKHQGDGQPTDTSDWDQHLASVRAGQNEDWWRANVDLPAYYNFHAVNRIVGNVDLRDGFNHYFYHSPDGLWRVIAWDLDMMFIAKAHQPSNAALRNNPLTSGTIDHRRALDIAALRIEFRNRARELLDLVCADPAPDGGQIGQLLDEYAQMVNPSGQALTWADVDAAMWNQNPRTATAHRGNFFATPFTDSRRGGTWVRTLISPDFEGQMKFLLDYATNTFNGTTWGHNNGNQLGFGYEYLEFEAADAAIPERPAAVYSGPPSHPLNDLRFTSSDFADPQGAGTFAAAQWRVGEISAPGIPLYDSGEPRIYEVTDVWRSPELPSNGEALLLGNVLRAGHTYRVRVRHKDDTGRWSRWSEPVQFVAGAADTSAYQDSLVVSEFMYNPAPASSAETLAGFVTQDFEYIEILNVGGLTLDLGGIGFSRGVTFTFPAGISLAPDERVLVVKNEAAFALRYGFGLNVAGNYGTTNLDNGGERVSLAVAGTDIVDFTYDDVAPWPPEADGAGYSLVLIDPYSLPNPALASSWRLSRLPGGNPGAPDTIGYAQWVEAYSGAGGSESDPDGDSFSNLLEYAFGTDPLSAASAPATGGVLQEIDVGGVAGAYLTLSVRRQIAPADLVYVVEFSDDLAEGWVADGVLVSRTRNSDGTETELWRSAQTLPDAAKLFARVRVTGPASLPPE